MTTDAPAKLNLSLRVLGRRDDGFHELESLMVQLPGLADRLTVEPAEADAFHCDAPGVPLDAGNLVVRARDRFREAAGVDPAAGFLSVRLEKRIPHGAGLGGGSSDAAAMLMAMQRLHDDALPREQLLELAAGLGSDVPFFLGDPVMRVRGRGEILEAVDGDAALPSRPVLLLKPSFGVSTPDAYRGWRDARELPGVDYAPQEFGWATLVNDLERPVFQKHLFLAEVKEWLRRQPGVEGALMSGSGSTVFAVLAAEELGESLAAGAREALDPTLWSWCGTCGASAE